MQNESAQRVSFVLGLEVGTDFADLFTVKDRDFSLGNPERAQPLPPPAEPELETPQRLAFVDDDWPESTHVFLSHAGEVDGGMLSWRVELDPRAEWAVSVGVTPSTESTDGFHPDWPDVEHRFGEEWRTSRSRWPRGSCASPQLRASWDPLHHAFHQSVATSPRSGSARAMAWGSCPPPGCRGS